MTTDLKARPIPTGIPMSGAFQAAKLDFISRAGGTNIHRKGGFEQHLLFVPIRHSDKVNPRQGGIYPQPLGHGGSAKSPDQPEGTTQWSFLLHNCFHQVGDFLHLFLVVDVNIPGVKIHWLVFKGLQYISSKAWRKHFALAAAVKNGCQLPV